MFFTYDNPDGVRCDAIGGVAYARCDYATTIETVRFAAGERLKAVTIPIIDDAHMENSEVASLNLTSPVGGGFFGGTTASLHIIDNDAAPSTTNPIDASPFFVRMQYLDFLSREPEEAGFDAWLNVLNNCSDANSNPACDRNTVSSSFFRSQEFELKGFYVYLFYKAALGRRAEYAEVIPDMRQVTGQTTEEVIAQRAAFADSFARRVEFMNLYGGMLDQQFVDALMNRYALQQITTEDPQDPDGATQVTLTRQQLTNQLTSGTLTRAKVLRGRWSRATKWRRLNSTGCPPLNSKGAKVEAFAPLCFLFGSRLLPRPHCHEGGVAFAL
ncbi:MAG: hypothetical protein ACRD9R_19725 [Pyrinomonadaceae bacterium]